MGDRRAGGGCPPPEVGGQQRRKREALVGESRRRARLGSGLGGRGAGGGNRRGEVAGSALGRGGAGLGSGDLGPGWGAGTHKGPGCVGARGLPPPLSTKSPSCAPTRQARGVRGRDQLSSLFWGHGLGCAAPTRQTLQRLRASVRPPLDGV